MAYKFLIKAYKPGPKDRFYLFTNENSPFLIFYAKGLGDLRNTLRAITPKAIRMPSGQWFSRRLRLGEPLELLHPLLKTRMFDVKKIEIPVQVEKEIEFTSSFNFTHKIKYTKAEF